MEHFSVQIFLLCALNKESKYNSQHEDLELVLENKLTSATHFMSGSILVSFAQRLQIILHLQCLCQKTL